MFKSFKALFRGRQPAGPAQTIRAFHTSDAPIAKDRLLVDEDSWLVDSRGDQTVNLFEVPSVGAEHCMLTFKAQMKTDNLRGRAFLEMWCRVPGLGEFFSKGLNKAVRATTDWALYEIPFFLEKGQKVDLIKLNLVVQGVGKTWIKDVELMKTPLNA